MTFHILPNKSSNPACSPSGQTAGLDLGTDKSKKITLLKQALIEFNSTQKVFREPSEHIHTSDVGLRRAILEAKGFNTTTDKLRVGLIVGNGSILSLLKDIPVDVIIMVDKNQFIHEWTDFTKTALAESVSVQEYSKKVYGNENPLLKELDNKRTELTRKYLTRGINDLGDMHLLHSQNRFEICKEELKEKEILGAYVDLARRDVTNNFAKILKRHNAEITFLNFTNLCDWYSPNTFDDSIAVLPFCKEPIIIYSSIAENVEIGGLSKVFPIARNIDTLLRDVNWASNSFPNIVRTYLSVRDNL